MICIKDIVNLRACVRARVCVWSFIIVISFNFVSPKTTAYTNIFLTRFRIAENPDVVGTTREVLQLLEVVGVVWEWWVQHSVHLKIAQTLTRTRPHDDHLSLHFGTAAHSLHGPGRLGGLRPSSGDEEHNPERSQAVRNLQIKSREGDREPESQVRPGRNPFWRQRRRTAELNEVISILQIKSGDGRSHRVTGSSSPFRPEVRRS